MFFAPSLVSGPDGRAVRLACAATRGRSRKGGSASPSDPDDDEETKSRKKREILDDVIARINEQCGAGTCVPLSTVGPVTDVATFSTGILPLDVALGGGWPRGRLVEIYGHESSGKTTLALYAVAQLQRMKETVVMVDAEHALDPAYAQKLGVVTEGPDRLIMVQPNCGEDGITAIEEFARSGQVSLVVVDSVSALVPHAEIEGLIGEGSLGQLARLMSAAMRRLAGPVKRSGCTVLFLNQIRNKIGVYGNPETTTGGVALKYQASVRCEVRATERRKLAGEDIGYQCRVRMVKNKVGMPYTQAVFDILHGRGVQHEAALLDVSVEMGLVEQKSSWFTLDGRRIQGAERASMYLRDNPDVKEDLEQQVREKIKEGGGLANGVAVKKVPVDDGGVEYVGEEEEDDESFADTDVPE